MNTATITINNQSFSVKFGIKSDRILADMWSMKKQSEVFAKLQKGFGLKPKVEPTFDQLFIISELVLSGIKSKHPNATIDEDDVYPVIFGDAEKMVELIQLYWKSKPQFKEEDKKKVNPAVRKK